MSVSPYGKLLPRFVAFGAKEFYQGCKRHELLIQRCAKCGTYRHYPHPMCSKCYSMDREWVKVSGRGKIYSYAVNRKPDLYIIAIVELPEKVRLLTNLVDCEPEDVYIDMPVEVVFTDMNEEITLPLFRPAS